MAGVNLDTIFRTKVNITATLFGSAGIIALTRLSSLLPTRYYFTFQDFILNPTNPEQYWISLTAKLLIPVFVGSLVGYIWRDEGKIAGAVGGFVGPFLMMWPFLTNWAAIAPDEIADNFNFFVLLYCLYIVASTYLCMAGSLLGQYLITVLKFVPGEPIVISWNEVIKTATKGLIAFGAEQALHRVFT